MVTTTMSTAALAVPDGGLAAWAAGVARRSVQVVARGLRFAFYGRVSTEDWQDPVSSRARQVSEAQAVIAGEGRIVAEFFDLGSSRTLAWPSRPQAARLLAALADADRGFDAIVVGSHERAFYGNQFTLMVSVFEYHGVQLWLPEVGGRLDPSISSLQELGVLLGIVSQREVVRARRRTVGSMSVQVREQGRFMGGRPPYGFVLKPSRPHPNWALARRGVCLQVLECDPATGPIVSWMFRARREGSSLARITRALNEAGIPCPSAADALRNQHRGGEAWTVGTVRAILGNPAYTGRAVWNRQRTDRVLVDPDNPGLGHREVVRWNNPDQWIISREATHAAVVSEADFVAV